MRRDFTLPSAFRLRDYQRGAVDWMKANVDADPSKWHLFSSPTGTGKSLMELSFLSEVDNSIMITPRIEIIQGMCEKMGQDVSRLNDIQLTNLAWQNYGIITPIRLRNMLARGEMEFMPSVLMIDECFPAGTLISTPNGQVPIDSIKVGDMVMAYNTVDRNLYPREVLKTFKNPMPHRGMQWIESRNNGHIYCTEGHPFYTENEIGERQWTQAGDLIVSDHEVLIQNKEGKLVWDELNWALECRIQGDGFVYNIEVEGLHTYVANGYVVHNCHHDTADTYQDITMYLNGCPKVGLTATPYRGTPKGTREFHRQWGDTVNQILSLRDAVEMGFYQIPSVEIWPLLDDDTIDVSNGDFRVNTCEAKLNDSLDIVVQNCERMYDSKAKLWDMPTIFSLPGTRSVEQLHRRFVESSIPTTFVTQATKRFDRIKAFEACVECRAALIQINVVSEGVDLPIRRVIDCSPTMSPNRWFQQVGRIRPDKSGVPPEYICCCRNLERHCYLWEGLLPDSSVKEAQTAFMTDEGVPLPSKRSGTRVVGLEGLGKFTTTDVPLMSGINVFIYNLVHVEGNKRTEYMAVLHPNNPEPVYAVKESANDGVEMKWGKWRVVERLPDLKGCQSAKVYPLTEKQEARWKQSAEGKGLSTHVQINSRQFQLLPMLLNTGLSFR